MQNLRKNPGFGQVACALIPIALEVEVWGDIVIKLWSNFVFAVTENFFFGKSEVYLTFEYYKNVK